MDKIAVPLKVGPVEVRNRVFLAPMSGVSDLPFRKRAYAHGAGLVVSEMVASEELCKARAESRMRASNGGLPIHMLQLAGREAKWMAEAARIAGVPAVRVAVQDHGPGLDDGVRAQALDPLFTTRAKGSGLGLPIVDRIVIAHHGTLALRNAPAGGLRVVILLPCEPGA